MIKLSQQQKKAIIVARLQCSCVFFLIAILLHLFFPSFNTFKLVVTILWFLFFLFFELVFIIQKYKNQEFTLSNSTLTIKKGIFYKKTYSISIAKIQYTKICYGLLLQPFHLANIKIVTPGGKISLYKLFYDTCKTLETRIISTIS